MQSLSSSSLAPFDTAIAGSSGPRRAGFKRNAGGSDGEAVSISAAEHGGAAELTIAVAVVCATADADSITSTFSSLAAAGISPRAVGGVETDDRPMSDALTRASTPTVFVIVTSAELPSDRVRRLVECFTAHRGPAHRLLVLDFTPGRAHSLLSPIRRAAGSLRRQLKPLSRPQAPTHDRPQLRVVPSPPKVVETPTEIELFAAQETRQLPVIDPDASPATESMHGSVDRASFAAAETVQLPIVLPPPPKQKKIRLGTLATAGAWAIAAVWAFAAFESIEAQPARQASAAVPVDLPVVLSMPPKPTPKPPPPSPSTATVVESVPPPPARLDGGAASIDTAITEGRIHSLDLLLSTTPYVDTIDWWKAANRCKSRSVSGIRDWRLPKPTELRQLRRAHLIPNGVFWTGARVVGSDVPSNWAYDTGAGMVRKPKAAQAQALCVRKR